MMSAKSLSQGCPLSALLRDLLQIPVAADVYVTGLAAHSRKVTPGDLFMACTFGSHSSIPYIKDAVKAGACAVVADTASLPELYICPVPLYRISNLYEKRGLIADRFYHHPSSAMTVIGITGTNGKTTVSHLLAQSLTIPGKNLCGLIGTMGYGTLDRLAPGPNTTPEPIVLHGLLDDMRKQNIRQVAIEISSHGLDQFRIGGVEFDLAVFTNLGRDHLDYHGTMENYAAAKRRLFTDYQISQAVINIDDRYGYTLFSELNMDAIGCTLDAPKELPPRRAGSIVYGRIKSFADDEMCLEVDSPWGKATLNSRLSGRFNAHNQLAALSSLCLLGHSLEHAVIRLSGCRPVPGRMERFGGGNRPVVMVDYAHTPDALSEVLGALRGTCTGKLYCVFGCGGDRDKGKRPLMGSVAERYADSIVITSDNPRFENPDAIIRDILSGIKNHNIVSVEVDRKNAIQKIIRLAAAKDIVLIAGKGHEDYQEIAGRRRPFSDQQLVREVLENGRD
jgi:UDP-N-acetylmuramyl-tripeptide synthetase